MSEWDDEPGCETVIARALTLRSRGRLDLAIELLREAVSAALGEPALVILLAKMIAESGDPSRAERWFRHALKLAPDSPDVRLGYAVWQLEMGRHQAGRALLESLHAEAAPRECDADNPPGFLRVIELNLATVCIETGDAKRALELAQRWLGDEEGWGQAHNALVDACEMLGQTPAVMTEMGFMTRRFSPLMCIERLERLLEAPLEATDFSKIEETVRLSDEHFDFDWRRCDEVVIAVLARARQTAAHAMMRGLIGSEACPSLFAEPVHEDEDEDEDESA